MSSKIKEKKTKEKAKRKIKIKIKEKRIEKSRRFALKPEHGPRGLWGKPLKPGALNLHWLGVADLMFTTRVDG